MDSSRFFYGIATCQHSGLLYVNVPKQEGSAKQSKIIAVDWAKAIFEIAAANHQLRIIERQHPSRAKFARFLAQHLPPTVIMQSCGTAQYCARQVEQAGHRARIIPAQYVRPARRRTKTRPR